MSLKKYLNEAELAAVQPITGDEFDISIRELTNIETVVLEHTEGSITIALDETAMKMLEHCGCTFEDEDEEDKEQVDELAPVIGAIGGALGRGVAAGAGALARGAAKAVVGTGIKAAHDKLDKKLFGPKPTEGDYEYDESLNDIRRLSGMKIDELSPAAKQKYVKAVTDKGNWFSGPAQGSLAGLKRDMDTVSNYAGKGKDERNYSPRWKKLHKDIQDKYDRRALTVNKVQGQLSRMGETKAEEDLGEGDVVQFKKPALSGNNQNFQIAKQLAKDLYWIRSSSHYTDEDNAYEADVEQQLAKIGYTADEDLDAGDHNIIITHKATGKQYRMGEDELLAEAELTERSGDWLPAAAGVLKAVAFLIGVPIIAMGQIYKNDLPIIDSPLGKAMYDAAARGDSYAKQELNRLEDLGVKEIPMQYLEKLSNQYLHKGKLGESAEYQTLRAALTEAEYQGRKVQLGKPMQGDVKKFKVYVKDPKTGNVKKVNFGDPNMRIKKSNPERRKSFRARHNCDNPGPRTKARYWSCRKW